MTPTSITERLAIHTAVCRARRAGMVCSTCTDLAERAGSYTLRYEAA